MKNIFSNRWFQGGIAITAIAIAFFAYQGTNTGEVQPETTAEITEAPEGSEVAIEVTNTITPAGEEVKIENTVNNPSEADMINSANEEETK